MAALCGADGCHLNPSDTTLMLQNPIPGACLAPEARDHGTLKRSNPNFYLDNT
jgi:hypothetical protein